MKKIKVQTNNKAQFEDITPDIQAYVEDSGVNSGIVFIYTPHTTASLVINENADPDVIHDILYKFDEFISWNDKNYRHYEGNSAAHMKSIICGNQKMVNIENGKLVLGTWESVFLAEFDGPRERSVILRIIED